MNLDIKEKSINEEMMVLDSLKKDYLNIRIKESNKEVATGTGTGTNFFMGNSGKNELIKDETALIDRIYALENTKLQINTSRITGRDLVNVISDFPDSGYNISEWTDKKKFMLPILFFGITFLGFLAFTIGKYLSDEDKKMSNLKIKDKLKINM